MSNGAAATILIVDDEPHNRKLLEALLGAEDYRTRSVGSGEEALEAIAAAKPDLVLLDLMMPGMDGLTVCRTLKADAATGNIPVIMVTSLGERSVRMAALDSGVEEFLTKPIDRRELSLRVRNLLRLKSYNDLLQHQSAGLEKAVRERSAELQQFRSAMDATADAIFMVNRATMSFVEFNATACKLLGYTREELFRLGPGEVGVGTLAQLELLYDHAIAADGEIQTTAGEVHRKDGTVAQIEVHRHALRSGDDWIIVGVARDVTERNEGQKRLHQLANFDALTGLANRRRFVEILERNLVDATERGCHVAVVFVDVDHFKNVNDTWGHAAGDHLLMCLGERLVDTLQSRDTVARLGSDEFALILEMTDGHYGAAVVADKLKQSLREPIVAEGQPIPVTLSIGISVFPDDAPTADALLRFAAAALHRSKQEGRDTFRFFTAQMNAEVTARNALEAAVRVAVERGEFLLHFQPKVDLGSGRIVGVEALLRWDRPGHGLVPPHQFIGVLEDLRLIVPVGSWVVATACKQIASWLASPIGPMQISVNVSGRQFSDGDLYGDVVSALRESGIPPALLELELTESSMMADAERTIATLQNLRTLGVQISIDDFGTGYSSLAYLGRFPLDKLKIDMCFVRDIAKSEDGATIALAIIRMAKSLRLEVIAEGVETLEQLEYLRSHECDQIQGYYFSRPLPLAELEELLRSGKTLASMGVAPSGD